MGLKLEVGKYYKTRDGRKVGPMAVYLGDPDWATSNDGTLRLWEIETGKRYAHEHTHDDLIAEWTDAPTGPVRTVTRKEIVPGSYGGVEVTHVDYATKAHGANVCIRIDNGFGPDSLRAAIATLTEIADALEDNQ